MSYWRPFSKMVSELVLIELLKSIWETDHLTWIGDCINIEKNTAVKISEKPVGRSFKLLLAIILAGNLITKDAVVRIRPVTQFIGFESITSLYHIETQTHNQWLCWPESGSRLFNSVVQLVLGGCAREIHLTFINSVCEQSNLSSTPQLSFSKEAMLIGIVYCLRYSSALQSEWFYKLFYCLTRTEALVYWLSNNKSDSEYTEDIPLQSEDPDKLHIFRDLLKDSASFGCVLHFLINYWCGAELAWSRALFLQGKIWVKFNLTTWSCIGWSVLAHA